MTTTNKKAKQSRGSKRPVVILEKRDGIQIRIQESEFKERRYIDVREYYRDDNDEWRPTRKGCTVPLDARDELMAGVIDVVSDIEDREAQT